MQKSSAAGGSEEDDRKQSIQDGPKTVSPKQFTVALIIIFIRSKCSSKKIYNKNLAIANRSRVSCAHNTLRASIGLNITP